VDEQSVYHEIKCHSGRSETYDVSVGGRLVGVKTLRGRSVDGRFIKTTVYDSGRTYRCLGTLGTRENYSVIQGGHDISHMLYVYVVYLQVCVQKVHMFIQHCNKSGTIVLFACKCEETQTSILYIQNIRNSWHCVLEFATEIYKVKSTV
jgi:hypothetical protein